MYNESVLMVSNNGAAPEASLLFPPISILSVKNSHLDIEYFQGIGLGLWKRKTYTPSRVTRDLYD